MTKRETKGQAKRKSLPQAMIKETMKLEDEDERDVHVGKEERIEVKV